MKKTFFLLLCGFLFFGCKETVFEAGLENRLTAIIDMSPESYDNKVDFKITGSKESGLKVKN